MSARLALLCPGQGAQHRDMFSLSGGLPMMPLPADDATLFENAVAQPLIVDATLAMWQAIQGFTPAPTLVAGYSIGELAAYGVAGAYTRQAGVELARERARLMDGCRLPGQAQAMLAVAALPRASLLPLLQRHGFHIAIENSDVNFIVGGLAQHGTALAAELEWAGASVTPLDVHIASHTPLMAAAAAGFSALLEARLCQAPRVPVLAGVSAERIVDPAQARASLLRQLTQTVRWAACMDALAEAGITVALELGPGATLSRMLQQRHPQIACRSVADFRSLAGIEKWLGRVCDGA